MFEYIVGKIVETKEKVVILEANSIGYKIFCSSNTVATLDNEAKLYLYQHIKEDAHQLYGFSNRDERELFLIFINTNGIGPKLAIDILSMYTISQLRDCIVNERYAILTKVSGLGIKKAQKLVIEAKDKIKLVPSLREDFEYDLIDALVNLGYSKKEIHSKLGTYSNIEEGLKDMLSKLG